MILRQSKMLNTEKPNAQCLNSSKSQPLFVDLPRVAALIADTTLSGTVKPWSLMMTIFPLRASMTQLSKGGVSPVILKDATLYRLH
eukprot:s1398_g13.t1